MRVISTEELVDILDKHKKWLRNEPEGERANLAGANLAGTNLFGTNLFGTNLFGADLSGADLFRANLAGANLAGANLAGANLTRANLTRANLTGADLTGANLTGANLTRAYLTGADLTGAKNINSPMTCPEEGSFIGFKKAYGNYIVKLEIPEDALRSSATGRKCRCSKAKVISITNIDGTDANVNEVFSIYDYKFVYRVGDTVYVDNFDPNRWSECAPGIHFFITRQEAVDY